MHIHNATEFYNCEEIPWIYKAFTLSRVMLESKRTRNILLMRAVHNGESGILIWDYLHELK